MRALRADEIEVRIGTVGEKGCTMLLYKNARVDMQILDEEFGPMNWQRDHKEIKGNLYCGVGIWDEDKKTWVWKWDCGVESNTEREKGEASDSFKRACTNHGIGRELYTSPRIKLEVATDKIGDRKYVLHNKFDLYGVYVSYIDYIEQDGKRIISDLALAQKDWNGREHEIWRMK